MVKIQIEPTTEVNETCHGLDLSKAAPDILYIGNLHYRSDGSLAEVRC